MSVHRSELSIEDARLRLGLQPDASLDDLQAAFQRAMLAARDLSDHVPPDAYREILLAYRMVRRATPEATGVHRHSFWPAQIELTPEEAVAGGDKAGRLPCGRPFQTRLPGALRDGDLLWVWGWLLQVRIDEGQDLAVRGDDIWVVARRAPSQLRPGTRLSIGTPLGLCSFRLSEDAVRRGLVRAPGLGLPASRGHAQGDLYVQLVEDRAARPPILRRLGISRAA